MATLNTIALLINSLIILNIIVQENSKQTVDFNKQDNQFLLKFSNLELSTGTLIFIVFSLLAYQFIIQPS